MKKAGNDDRRAARRPRDPSDQRARRRLLPRADARRAGGLLARAAPGRATPPPRTRADWVAGFSFPDFERDYEFVALRHPDEYPLVRGAHRLDRAVSTSPCSDYDAHFVEEQVPHSNALHSRVRGRGAYLVRTARALQPQLRSPLAAGAGRGARGGARPPSCRNPFQSIARARGRGAVGVRRGARASSTRYEPPPRPFVDVAPRAATGYAAHRGAARVPLPPLRARRRRARSSTPRSSRRPRRTSRPSRRTSRASRRSVCGPVRRPR